MVFRGTRRTYQEFNEDVNRFANAMLELGLEKGDRFSLLSHNCYQYAVMYFALAKIGVILVPINFMLRAEEAAYILAHSESRAFFVEDALLGVGREALAKATGVEFRGIISLAEGEPPRDWMSFDDLLQSGSAKEPEVEFGDDEVVQIAYTSGTESLPKGAMLTNRNLISQYVSVLVDGGFEESDIQIHALPLYHCAQLHVFLSPAVYVGATNIILYAPVPDEIMAAVEREKANLLFCPPTVWISLLRSPNFDKYNLSTLQKCYYGAAIMPVEVLRELTARLQGVRFWNFYGQTEMSPLATCLKPEEQFLKPGSAGRPVLNVETRLVDDDMNDVAPGEVGEIVHRSPHAMLGYYKDEEKTAAAFRGGWFHSGDLAVADEEGFVTIVDRKKDMIKTGGENVASREVEEVVYRHPGVSEVAVIGVPHPYWIEAVTAVVVPKSRESVAPDEIIAHCRQHLAAFKVPKYVVLAESLPKNPSGKILKRQLRDEHAGLAGSEGAQG